MGSSTGEDEVKAKLVVFDLDYTLWPFWCDTHVDPPFTKKGDTVYDSRKRIVKFYSEVPTVLEYLVKENYKIGAASRTSAVDIANNLIKLFNWEHFFQYKQIYPGSKVTHFQRLRKESGLEYCDMIFFDDEERNIQEVGKLGVCCIFVETGVKMSVLTAAFKTFSETYSQRQKM